MNAIGRPVEHDRWRWPIWHAAVLALALLFVLYQVVIPPPPPREPMMVFNAATAIRPAQALAPDTCPPGDACLGIVIDQALPRLPVPPLLLLVAVAALLFAVRRQPRPHVERHGWWWPPDRRRALLQVFLI